MLHKSVEIFLARYYCDDLEEEPPAERWRQGAGGSGNLGFSDLI